MATECFVYSIIARRQNDWRKGGGVNINSKVKKKKDKI